MSSECMLVNEKKSGKQINTVSRFFVAISFIFSLGFMSLPASADETITVYKSPTCGCCKGWVGEMRANGFKVNAIDTNDVTKYKKEAGVPQKLYACHTAYVNGYVIEGHVPASAIKRLLAEKPTITGLAVPGMPAGSPGMGGKKVRYAVRTFDKSGKITMYSTH